MKIRLPTRDDGEKFMKFVKELEQEGTLETGELTHEKQYIHGSLLGILS